MGSISEEENYYAYGPTNSKKVIKVHHTLRLVSRGNGIFTVMDDSGEDDGFGGIRKDFDTFSNIKLGHLRKKKGRIRLDPHIKADTPLGFDTGQGPESDYEDVVDVLIDSVGARANSEEYGWY
jgi:hypothetical protein